MLAQVAGGGAGEGGWGIAGSLSGQGTGKNQAVNAGCLCGGCFHHFHAMGFLWLNGSLHCWGDIALLAYTRKDTHSTNLCLLPDFNYCFHKFSFVLLQPPQYTVVSLPLKVYTM